MLGSFLLLTSLALSSAPTGAAYLEVKAPTVSAQAELVIYGTCSMGTSKLTVNADASVLVDGTSTVVVNTVELDAIGVFEILAAAALLDVAAPQSVASASQRINAESALLVETQPELSSDGSVSINVVVGSFVDAPSIESTWASSIGATSSLVVTAPTILVDTRFIYDPCTIPIGLMSLCGVSVGVDASDIVVALEVDSLGDVSVEVVGIVASVPMLAASLVGVGISMEVQS